MYDPAYETDPNLIDYPEEDLKDLPIVLLCGKTDKLCMPGDYLALRDRLKEYNSLKDFVELLEG